MAISDIIKNLDLKKLKAPSGLTYAQELVNAANLLSECIQTRINRGSLSNSISTADIADIKVSGNTLTVTLKIQNAIRKQEILDELEILDKKRIRALAEPSLIDCDTTWLEHYNTKIIALREELSQL